MHTDYDENDFTLESVNIKKNNLELKHFRIFKNCYSKYQYIQQKKSSSSVVNVCDTMHLIAHGRYIYTASLSFHRAAL